MDEPFGALDKRRLEELIHPPTEENEDDNLHIIRMTQVGDDVKNIES
jgi:hypothetical protein